MKQQIVSRFDSTKILFECDVPEGIANGWALRYALEKAVKAKASLRDADLRGAELRGADLRGADLSGADLSGTTPVTDEQSIANLDKVREIILDDSKRLYMGHWHADDSAWENKSCAEEMLCGTTHCLAGWLQVCSTDPKVRALDAQMAGISQAPVAAQMFFRPADEVVTWLTDRTYVADIASVNARAEERKARKAAEAV